MLLVPRMLKRCLVLFFLCQAVTACWDDQCEIDGFVSTCLDEHHYSHCVNIPVGGLGDYNRLDAVPCFKDRPFCRELKPTAAPPYDRPTITCVSTPP